MAVASGEVTAFGVSPALSACLLLIGSREFEEHQRVEGFYCRLLCLPACLPHLALIIRLGRMETRRE